MKVWPVAGFLAIEARWNTPFGEMLMGLKKILDICFSIGYTNQF
jgi:hypothetical protein